MTAFSKLSPRQMARWAGVCYLGIAALGVFSIAYVPSQILVVGDPMASLSNVVNKSALFQLGIAADMGVMVLEILIIALFYNMFKPVSPILSLIAAMARFAMVCVMAVMLFFYAGIDALADVQSMASFSPQQRAEMVGVLFQIHHAGIWVWQIFFGLHLICLGLLVVKSGQFPKAFGIGLAVGALGYVLDTLFGFAYPDVAWLGYVRIALLAIVTLSELGFALWLLIRGPKPSDEGAMVDPTWPVAHRVA